MDAFFDTHSQYCAQWRCNRQLIERDRRALGRVKLHHYYFLSIGWNEDEHRGGGSIPPEALGGNAAADCLAACDSQCGL